MAIRPKLRIPKARPLADKGDRRVLPESIDWLAEHVFKRWQDAPEDEDGCKDKTLTMEAADTYGRAVQLGFRGHIGKWVDKVFAAGGLSIDDFPDMPGQGELE